MLGDECLQAQAFIQLAYQKEAGVGGDARSLECDFQKAIERELKRLVRSFTHRVSLSVAGCLASESQKSRRGDLVLAVRYHSESGNPSLHGNLG